MDGVVELTNDSFASKIETSTGYALVDFWAPWCGPCRMMAPIFEEIAKETKNVVFFKANIEEAQDLANRFRVQSIPCFLLFKDGKAVASRTGGTTKENFIEWIKENTKK